ncbi:hypothetical protein Trydic_g10806 [Trypoxylus dichotomus]
MPVVSRWKTCGIITVNLLKILEIENGCKGIIVTLLAQNSTEPTVGMVDVQIHFTNAVLQSLWFVIVRLRTRQSSTLGMNAPCIPTDGIEAIS